MFQRTNLSLKSLILTNILFGLYFIFQGGGIVILLWVFWFQSVIIGIVNFVRILTQKNYSVDGLIMNGVQVQKNEHSKKITALFFLVHYGLFHLAYFGFLISSVPYIPNPSLILGFILFGINHAISFLINFREESLIEKNIGSLMFYPYIRIIPMHLIILFGAIFIRSGEQTLFLIVFFLVLKTIADIGMHIVEHKLFRRES